MTRRLLSLPLALAALPALAQEFPVTLAHERGSLTLDSAPERIVSIGVHEQDFLYALGIAPVGVHEWFGEQPYATWPWAEAAREAAGAEPEVLTGWEINVEWVAALQPDLIVASYLSDLDDATFDLLGRIAPVITAPPGYPAWGAPWQEELRLLGAATGTGDRAEEVIADLDRQLEEARAEYPQLAGKTAGIGYFFDGVVRTYNSADTAHRFLADFGLVIPDEYDTLSVERGHVDVSPETLGLIDLDVFVFPEEPETGGDLAALSVYQSLDLARDGRAINLGGGELSAALSFQTPLALGWLYETLPPMLAAAADGDPDTAIPAVR